MGKGNFSGDSKRDAVAQITEHGYPVPLSGKSGREYSEWVGGMGRGWFLNLYPAPR